MAQWRSGAVAQWRSGAVAQWRSGAVAQWRSGAVAQWRSGAAVRTPDPQSRDPGSESSCYRFKAWAISFSPRCSSSFCYINRLLAVDRGGYMNEQSSPRSNCSVVECLLEKSSWNWKDSGLPEYKALSVPKTGLPAVYELTFHNNGNMYLNRLV